MFPFRLCQAFLSPSLHETTINERADFKGPLGWRDCMSGIWGRKKVPYCSLAPSLCLPSFPLRTDRSFDSGSKFTLQTCWEAGECSYGKAFLHFKDPERLPDSLSEILKLIINLFLHSRGCETSTEAPGWRRELEESNLCEGIGWPDFYRQSNCSNSWSQGKEWHLSPPCTYSQMWRALSTSNAVPFILKDVKYIIQ